jgi:hypothetical protein
VLRDIGADFKLPPVTGEVFFQVASVLEAVHDVGEVPRVFEAERVAAFVDTGKEQNRGAKKRISFPSRNGRIDNEIENGLPIFQASHALTIETADARIHPDEAERSLLTRFRGRQNELAVAGGLPVLHRGVGKVRIGVGLDPIQQRESEGEKAHEWE